MIRQHAIVIFNGISTTSTQNFVPAVIISVFLELFVAKLELETQDFRLFSNQFSENIKLKLVICRNVFILNLVLMIFDALWVFLAFCI